MTFLEQLQSHKGGLIRLKTELFWYNGRGWDDSPGRICLVLDVAATDADAVDAAAEFAAILRNSATTAAVALLLIDGKPQQIWVDQTDVELL